MYATLEILRSERNVSARRPKAPQVVAECSHVVAAHIALVQFDDDAAGRDCLRADRLLVDDAVPGAVPTCFGLAFGVLLAKCSLTHLWQVPAFAPDPQGEYRLSRARDRRYSPTSSRGD